MTNSFLRQAILVSFLWHITLFTMFGFSFGPKATEVNLSRVYFLGSILRVPDLTNSWNFNTGRRIGRVSGKPDIIALNKINREYSLTSISYSKPPISLAFSEGKTTFTEKPSIAPLMVQRKESAIMFYPKLPYNFTLYFKDRQSAHIELDFVVASMGKRSSVIVKRKISSGDLEADLLSMRYINRYISLQQSGFIPNKWQTVKIDLTTVND